MALVDETSVITMKIHFVKMAFIDETNVISKSHYFDDIMNYVALIKLHKAEYDDSNILQMM